MKTPRQAQREARQLFRLIMVDGALDETRVRRIVQRLVDEGRPGRHVILSRLHRLIRLHRGRHSAEVQSAVPLPDDVRARIETALERLHGREIVTSFTENADLLGGVRIRVGSDVYDGSVKGALSALTARF